jgi:hypothetical protein
MDAEEGRAATGGALTPGYKTDLYGGRRSSYTGI